MNIDIVEKNGNNVAVVYSDQILITDVQSALDFLMTVKYETGCANIAVNKDAIVDYYESELPVASMAEIETGAAEILTVVEGQKIEKFAVEIEKINMQSYPKAKGLVV